MQLVRKYGWGKGSGEYVAKQTNVKAMKTVVPVALGVLALGVASPILARQVAGSVATIPVVGPLTASIAESGTNLRARFGL